MTVLTVKGVRYQSRFPMEAVAATFRTHLDGAHVRLQVEPNDDVHLHVAADDDAVLAAAHMYLDPLAVEWTHDGGETP